MKLTRKMPDMIFFLNAGVRLTTTEDIIVGHLKELCDMGVEIYSCGTCLKFYELEGELKVGRVGSIDQVIDGMRDFTETIWI
jgi:hypothetical protein